MNSIERANFSLQEKYNKSTVLKQHYITPAECEIPVLVPKETVHHAIPVSSGRHHTGDGTLKDQQLDGFYLLEATGMGFPEDVQQALLADKRLTSIVEDDMSYFTELLYIDVSENSLWLAPFGAFPKLRELRLACNRITTINPELFGFENLLFLDLSYNKLNLEAVQSLEVLPNLRELDLCGNNLGSIPEEWQTFQYLEKLLLDYNKLENNEIFTFLSAAPNLRTLSVHKNSLSSFPDEALRADGFRYVVFYFFLRFFFCSVTLYFAVFCGSFLCVQCSGDARSFVQLFQQRSGCGAQHKDPAPDSAETVRQPAAGPHLRGPAVRVHRGAGGRRAGPPGRPRATPAAHRLLHRVPARAQPQEGAAAGAPGRLPGLRHRASGYRRSADPAGLAREGQPQHFRGDHAEEEERGAGRAGGHFHVGSESPRPHLHHRLGFLRRRSWRRASRARPWP
jgi:hypothetical protein